MSANVAARWVASYRLQLHAGFGFAAAADQVSYLSRLGISHLYLSPILKARQGSTHGYDVVDHAEINPELGGEAGYRALVKTARQAGMGVIVDIVPNHMAIGGADNRCWLELLEWGQRSRYAEFFDIDWDVPDPEIKGKVLVPLLGDDYGKTLESGALQMRFDLETGRLAFEHHEHRFPLAASLYAPLLRASGNDLLAGLVGAFRAAKTPASLAAACERLRLSARTLEGGTAMAALLGRFDPQHRRGLERLDKLLGRQPYRLASWRTATDDINWRRFFDVTTLAGLRVEEPWVFEAVHQQIFALYAEGLLDGVRVDHVDGLADPREYCLSLRRRLAQLAAQRPPGAPSGEAYVVLEKILAADERLPLDWQVEGTTGYSFMNDVGALAHDADGESALRALWTEQTGRAGDFETEVRAARRRIPQNLLAADFNACAHAFFRLARSSRATRDWTLLAIRRILIEVLVELPVYRTYIDVRGLSEADALIIRQTLDAARPRCRPSEMPLLEVFANWLSEPGSVRARPLRRRAIARFQQLSSPVAAKSVEDTAFYRHGLLLSRNEVGSNPRQFHLEPGSFHAEAEWRAERYPLAMLATATHDHKRGEDARMRLAALSEQPDLWVTQVRRWRNRHEALKPEVGDVRGPDAADELMLYQTLFGVWPFDLDPHDASRCAELADRVQQWQQKSIREAKRHTGWLEPNPPYEKACRQFLDDLLTGGLSTSFVAEMTRFVGRFAAAAAIKSLTQTVLKLTTPGLPDFYQGSECWDYSMVDPDNRRAVDYPRLATMLSSSMSDTECFDDWHSGGIKQRVIERLLAVRHRAPGLFTAGRYLQIAKPVATSPYLAFVRQWQGQSALVVVPLSPAAEGLDRVGLKAASMAITLQLPAGVLDVAWHSLLDGRQHQATEDQLNLRLELWPFDVLLAGDAMRNGSTT